MRLPEKPCPIIRIDRMENDFKKSESSKMISQKK